MDSIADVRITAATAMPRFEDGFINLQEVLRQLAESVVNEIMSAEADQLCGAPVFRLRDAGAVRAAYHLAIEMLESCCGDAARILEEAPTPEKAQEWKLVARRAINASLELADELEAA